MDKIKKSEDTNMETIEVKDEVLEETKTEKVGKLKLSLKKKLLIGGGIVVGLVLGAIALGTKKTATVDDQSDDSEDDGGEVLTIPAASSEGISEKTTEDPINIQA